MTKLSKNTDDIIKLSITPIHSLMSPSMESTPVDLKSRVFSFSPILSFSPRIGIAFKIVPTGKRGTRFAEKLSGISKALDYPYRVG